MQTGAEVPSRPHAVILGVGPGLGASMARTFARAGYDLTLVARTSASLAPVAQASMRLGVTAETVLLDLSDLAAVHQAVTAAGQRHPISLLHHNASMHAGGLLDADPEVLHQSLNVNVLAAVTAVRAALPDLSATGGLVTLTGNALALRPSGAYGVLSLGKAALRASGLALAQELAQHGVTLRMLTVDGHIRPGGAFDPERIAEAFWEFATSGSDLVERVYDGRG